MNPVMWPDSPRTTAQSAVAAWLETEVRPAFDTCNDKILAIKDILNPEK
jgi:hypothetical protein